MTASLLHWLKHPDIQDDLNLDDPATAGLHSKIIHEKKFLRDFYRDVYIIYADAVKNNPGAKYVELGSGGGFIKDIIPQTITSDIMKIPNVDLCFSGEQLPFKDASIDAFFLFNVLHHIKNPGDFLKEASRCLRIRGKIVMIEPANTPWSRFVYKNFHHESFNTSTGWTTEGAGPLSCANGAIPWIIFRRDQKQFRQKFPGFQIQSYQNHTPIRYLISGGVSMRQLLPGFMSGIIKGIEYLLTPLNNIMGMFCTIEVEKGSDQ
jgi:SAM-dependent methyltransferase